jgi:hypothetical protein
MQIQCLTFNGFLTFFRKFDGKSNQLIVPNKFIVAASVGARLGQTRSELVWLLNVLFKYLF